MEIKSNPLEACELKFNDDEWHVAGYATVFNSFDKVGDRIMPGAFTKTLEAKNPIRMHFEHLRWITPGKWEKAYQDEKGLRVEGYLTRGHSWATDLRASMRHGTIGGLSQGFNVPDGGYQKNEKGGRDIYEINLVEVSFTGNPAEPKATIESFKSEIAGLATLSDFENFLRESGGFTKSMATALIGQFKSVCRSESDAQAQEQMRELQAAMRLKSVLDKYDISKLIA
jgi:HK97 family phage prohead protease